MPTSDRAGDAGGRPVVKAGVGRGLPIYLSASPFGPGRLAEAGRIARALDCAGLDVNVAILTAGDPSAALADVPVAVVSVNWQSERPADLSACASVARILGARMVNVYPTLSPGDDPEAARRALISALKTALQVSDEGRPGLTLENALERPPGVASAGRQPQTCEHQGRRVPKSLR